MSLPRQTPAQLFIQMSGAPGSGKSTIAGLLGSFLHGVVIDHDVIRSSLLDSNIITFDQAAKQAYLLQWSLAHDIMKQGFSVIVDSTCNYPEVLAQGSVLASRHGCPYWYVECQVRDIDRLDQRLRSRCAMTSQRTAVDLPPAAAQSSCSGEDARTLFQKWIEEPCRPGGKVVIVDSTENLEIFRDRILKQNFIASQTVQLRDTVTEPFVLRESL